MNNKKETLRLNLNRPYPVYLPYALGAKIDYIAHIWGVSGAKLITSILQREEFTQTIDVIYSTMLRNQSLLTKEVLTPEESEKFCHDFTEILKQHTRN